MVSEKLKNLLNEAIAREIQVSIQYLWQHVLAKGFEGETVKGKLKEIAITEMKHAEAIAERLAYLGGTPTTKPNPITIGNTVREMIEIDKGEEEKAIELYKEIIKVAREEGDITTAKLFEEILADEEEHHDFFSSLLEG
ncbi:ferritin-like domain-containing protein [Ferroglobus sp.]|uniref:ferritin-like domain-containing protein n=1 Tax=Ferroglobus sp. TaxID=2614230 RepID=UPI0025BA487B|nr:ferritin-like domain-containing protein [Ferroglobus sp.]